MLLNSYKYLSAIALVGLFSVAACGDDDGDTTGSGGSGGSTATNSGGSGQGGSGDLTCTQACTVAYDCGAADDGALCPAFVPGGVDQMTFLNGPGGDDGCVATCEGNTLLIALITPGDCDTTIGNLKASSPDFVASCEGTGQGGGGMGGMGGAGGN